MKKRLQLIISVLFIVLASLAGHGQNVGEQFDIGAIFKIISKNPNEVEFVRPVYRYRNFLVPRSANYKGQSYAVTRIGENAFNGEGLSGVTFESPSNVRVIGKHAFKFSRLTEVTIPNSVTHIGHGSFAFNQLTSVTIPDNVTTIGTFAFRENQLSSITLGANVTDIGYAAFRLNQLTNVVIPNGGANIDGVA